MRGANGVETTSRSSSTTTRHPPTRTGTRDFKTRRSASARSRKNESGGKKRDFVVRAIRTVFAPLKTRKTAIAVYAVISSSRTQNRMYGYTQYDIITPYCRLTRGAHCTHFRLSLVGVFDQWIMLDGGLLVTRARVRELPRFGQHRPGGSVRRPCSCPRLYYNIISNTLYYIPVILLATRRQYCPADNNQRRTTRV